MKKFPLIALLFAGVLLLQNCKKDVVSAETSSTEPMIALINDTTWIADTVHAAITYNSSLKTKVFTCTGIANNKQINLQATQNSATNTTGFPLTGFTVNATSDIAMSYEYPQRNSSGNIVLAPQGIVVPGSGTVTFTVIDSVKKTISGTFSFYSIRNNYDENGAIINFTGAQISQGGFNNIPYTFTAN